MPLQPTSFIGSLSHGGLQADCVPSGDTRRPKIARLLELVQQKRILEERVEKCQSELEQMFLTTANQLQVVLSGRIESLNEGVEMVEMDA